MRALASLAGIVLCVALPAAAQVNTSTTVVDPTNPQSYNNPNTPDPLSQQQNGGFSMTNLIHQSNLGARRSADDVRQAQDRSIDDAVSRFRSNNVRLTPQLLNPASASAPAPATTPDSSTPKP